MNTQALCFWILFLFFVFFYCKLDLVSIPDSIVYSVCGQVWVPPMLSYHKVALLDH